MSFFLQIGDQSVTSIPPDGETQVDVYAGFDFAGKSIPEGTDVVFLIGIGELPRNDNDEVIKLTLNDVFGSLVPVDGISLSQDVAKVARHVVRGSNGLESMLVAKTSIRPISKTSVDKITIIAFSTFDKLGTIERLTAGELKDITISDLSGSFLSVVERFDPAATTPTPGGGSLEGKWETVTPLNKGRSGPFVESVDGKIYAIGGFQGAFLGDVEQYDPATDTWSARNPMPTPRGFGSSVVDGGKIFVMGGYNFGPGRASNQLDVYDPAGDSWVTKSPLPAPVAFSVAEVMGGKIYLMFGGSLFSEEDVVQEFNFGVFVYDIVADSWSIMDLMVAGAASTTLSESLVAGATFLRVPVASGLAPNGIVTLDRGSSSEEVVRYTAFDGKDGSIRLPEPTSKPHAAGTPIIQSSVTETRMGANSLIDSGKILVFNGLSYLGFNSRATSLDRSSVLALDVTSKTLLSTGASSGLARHKAAAAMSSSGDTLVAGGGSSDKSEFLSKTEIFDGSFRGPGGVASMLFHRHSMGLAEANGKWFAVGGGGSGRAPGWLQITATTSPQSVKADGRQTASLLVEAVDVGGDPPPDGIKFKARGIITADLSEDEKKALRDKAMKDGSKPKQGSMARKISVLPLLLSSNEMIMTDGRASTILLPRSEDPINEVNRLLEFARAGEEIPNQEALKSKAADEQANKSVMVNTTRSLYSAFLEVTINDEFFFGTTSTDGGIANVKVQGLSMGGKFSFNPSSASQGNSPKVDYKSDLASIPDVQVVTDEPTDGPEAKGLLDDISMTIPFGSSPHFDALAMAAQQRNIPAPPPPLASPSNVMVSVSDNDQNSSANSPMDVVDEANAVAGSLGFPIFINSFVITSPVSLSARKARTDVADLELISSETGGNSFSVIDSSFVDFVITRILTSAPSSIGSGEIVIQHQINGLIRSVRHDVSNLVAGNDSEMRLSHSMDGFNFTEIDTIIPPNVEFVIGDPVKARFVRYSVRLRSRSFDSPVLESVTIVLVKPSIQMVVTFPQRVSGQVSELAAVVNHRLPPGGSASIGISHGAGLSFVPDFSSPNQPAITERGIVTVINRSFDSFVGNDSTRDKLNTDDLIIYRSRSGPWPQDSVTRVFVNDIEALPDAFIAVPERGIVAFRRKLSENDIVTLEVQFPSTFRVGVRMENPSLQASVLDEFAFTWGATQDDAGFRLNRAPRAIDPFISSPVLPGGPLKANFTFVDPDGDIEDEEATQITWFRDGAPLPELNGKRSISQSDLVARRLDDKGIRKNQEWFFSVRPSDGRSFGPLVISPSVRIANVPPTAANVRIVSSNDDPTLFTTQDNMTAVFEFSDVDGDEAKGATYAWFSNGILVKEGGSNALTTSDQDANGNAAIATGNIIRVEIVPSDGTDFGPRVTSATVSVEGSAPVVSDVILLPKSPSSASNLRLTFTFTDADGNADQSRVAWFRDGTRVSELDGAREVSAVLTTPGQEWFATVTPFDGSKEGDQAKSNVVVINF